MHKEEFTIRTTYRVGVRRYALGYQAIIYAVHTSGDGKFLGKTTHDTRGPFATRIAASEKGQSMIGEIEGHEDTR